MTQSHDYATDDQKWAAGRARDVRADGLFWTGVLTTGVYCRPSCPGRPLRKNVRWFDSPAAARAAAPSPPSTPTPSSPWSRGRRG